MYNWFFFGTLMDPDVCAMVLGQRDLQPIDATLSGYRSVGVVAESYPALQACEGALIHGHYHRELSAEQHARICYFEGEEYTPTLMPISTADGQTLMAYICVATQAIELRAEPWSLTAWQEQHKAGYLPMTQEWMSGYGHAEFAQMQEIWLAKLNAQENKL